MKQIVVKSQSPQIQDTFSIVKEDNGYIIMNSGEYFNPESRLWQDQKPLVRFKSEEEAERVIDENLKRWGF